MFSGFRSEWISPKECKNAKLLRTCVPQPSTVSCLHHILHKWHHQRCPPPLQGNAWACNIELPATYYAIKWQR